MAPPAHKKRKLFPHPVGNGDNGISHNLDSAESSVEDSKVAKGTRSSLPTRKQGRHGSTPAPNGAYNLSTFQLQVDELLSKVRSHEGQMAKTENALRKLKNIIERIPNREPKAVRNLDSLVHWSFLIYRLLYRSCKPKERSMTRTLGVYHSPIPGRRRMQNIRWPIQNLQTSMLLEAMLGRRRFRLEIS